MPNYTPNFSGVIDALKAIIQTGIVGGGAAIFNYLPLISRTTSGDLIAIPALADYQIKVYGLIIELKGTTENIVLVKDNTVVIDQHLLVVKGDQSGFITEIPIYVLGVSNPLILNFSSTSEVIVSSILYRYEYVGAL
jgi:hypothetical protein